MRSRQAHTLIELVVALGVLAILLGIGAPPALRWRDAASVRSARDEIAAGLARARIAAVAHGGASLWLDAAAARFWVAALDGTTVISAVDLADRYGVRLETGSTAPVEVRFDALGIGRLANRTLRVRRRSAIAGLTISAYGRYRRW